MKRSDIWWAVAYGLLAVFTVLFCVTGGFAKVNIAYPYLAGFAQFAVYATAGEKSGFQHNFHILASERNE